MPRTYVKKANTGRLVYSQEDILRAVTDLEAGNCTIREVSRRYNVPVGTIHRRQHGQVTEPGRSGRTPALLKNEELEIAQNVAALGDYGLGFDTKDLCKFVQVHLNKSNRHIPQFKDNMPGVDWAQGFLKRQSNILKARHCQNISRKRAAVSEQTVKDYFEQLAVTLQDVPPQNILNYDETNLTDDPKTKLMLFRKGIKHAERIMNTTKSSTSIMFAVSATGTFLPSYVVYKGERMQDTWINGGPLSTKYNVSKSGWFDSDIFIKWFKSIVLPWARRLPHDEPKVVIGDNLASHMSLEVVGICEEHNIRLTFLPPNSTHLLQPLDVAVFATVKKAWRKIITDWKMGDGKYMTTLPKWCFPRLLLQLELEMEDSWERLCKSAFRACGIHPLDGDHVIAKLTHRTSNSEGKGNVSTELLNYLKETRESSVRHQKPRSKRVNVMPGATVSLSDLDIGPSTSKPIAGTRKQKRQRLEAEVESEDDDDAVTGKNQEEAAGEAEDIEEEQEDASELEKNGYVLVKFLGEGKNKYHFMGRLLEKKSGDYWKVRFYRKRESSKYSASMTMFKEPEVEDIYTVLGKNIIKKIKPKETLRGSVYVRSSHLTGYIVR